MTQSDDLTEEFLNRVRDRYSVDELCEILDINIDQFIDLTWDLLMENDFLQRELGIKEGHE